MLAKSMQEVWSLAAVGPAIGDFDSPRKWTGLLVIAGKERGAADWLKNSHLWVYWPNYCKQVACGTGRRNGRGARRAQLCSIIPGYLLMAVHPDRCNPWEIVHATPGIYGFVRDSTGNAALLTNEDIEIIRRIEAGLNLPFDPKSAHRFRPGDKVRFVDDIYSRWPVGTVKKIVEDGRISVDVPMMGRIVPVTVYPHQIEAM